MIINSKITNGKIETHKLIPNIPIFIKQLMKKLFFYPKNFLINSNFKDKINTGFLNY